MNQYEEQRKRFEDMKAKSLESLQSFVDFHLDEREKIRGSTQQYFGACAELTARRSKQKDRIDTLREERTELEEKIRGSFLDLDSHRSVIREMTVKRAQNSARIESLQLQLNNIRGLVDSSLREKDDQQAFIDQKESKILRDSSECERLLGLKVDSIDGNIVRFSFTNIDPNDLERQFTADIDLGPLSYKFVKTMPMLPREIMLSLEEKLNVTQNMKLFLKTLRGEFKKTKMMKT